MDISTGCKIFAAGYVFLNVFFNTKLCLWQSAYYLCKKINQK